MHTNRSSNGHELTSLSPSPSPCQPQCSLQPPPLSPRGPTIPQPVRASTELTRNVSIDRIVCHLGRVLDREVCRRRLLEIGSRQIARVHGADEPTRRVVQVPAAVQDSLANHVVLLQLGGEMRALVDDLRL